MRNTGIVMLAATLLGLGSSMARAANATLTVAYAGSMSVVMDRALGPAFAKEHHAAYRGIGRGAWGLARLIASGQLRTNVYVSVTPGPMRLLINKGLVKRAEPIASTQMVIAYSPRSRFAAQFRAAARGGRPWYKVLEERGIRFGRTDPAVDPQGRNIIFTMLLAQRYYGQPGLAHRILGGYRNPRQIFSETSLLSRLESGQIDATSGYLSAVISHHLPYIQLPGAINLGNPREVRPLEGKVSFSLRQADGKLTQVHMQPLVFYAGVLLNAPDPALARRFVTFLRSAQGQAMLRAKGYSRPTGSVLK